MSYAGYWPRLYAAMIDAVIVGFLEALLALPLMLIALVSPILSILSCVVTVVAAGAYFVLFESSRFQATPGKMALGLKVTDLRGEPISMKRGAVKIIIQYALYGIIFVIALVSAALSLAADFKSEGLPAIELILSNSAFLIPLVVGSSLYFACFFLLLFSDRKQTVFDRLTGRLVWSTKQSLETAGDIRLFVSCLVLVFGFVWGFALFRVMTHSSLEFADLMKSVLVVLLVLLALVLLVQLSLIFDLLQFDAYGFISHARTLVFLSLGSRRRLWQDRANAMSKYIQGDAKSADKVLANWQGKLSGKEMDYQLQIRLFGCLIACDDDGIIDTGLKMKLRQNFAEVNKLFVVGAFMRSRCYKEAIELLRSVTNTKPINPITLNVYFAAYYARMGCQKELDKTLSLLEKKKYSISNDFKSHLQGCCAAVNGNLYRARKLFNQSLSEIPDSTGSKNSRAVLSMMSAKRVKQDLAKLDSHVGEEAPDLGAYRTELKQIAKRLAIAGEED